MTNEERVAVDLDWGAQGALPTLTIRFAYGRGPARRAHCIEVFPVHAPLLIYRVREPADTSPGAAYRTFPAAVAGAFRRLGAILALETAINAADQVVWTTTGHAP